MFAANRFYLLISFINDIKELITNLTTYKINVEGGGRGNVGQGIYNPADSYYYLTHDHAVIVSFQRQYHPTLSYDFELQWLSIQLV